jgi:hypothetical protein
LFTRGGSSKQSTETFNTSRILRIKGQGPADHRYVGLDVGSTEGARDGAGVMEKKLNQLGCLLRAEYMRIIKDGRRGSSRFGSVFLANTRKDILEM